MTGSASEADRAEAQALDAARELCAVLAEVEVPARDASASLPERLSFLLARDNFECCISLLDAGQDVPAGNVARALFEKAVRWSWVDEDPDARRTAFLGAAAHRYRQVAEDARRTWH